MFSQEFKETMYEPWSAEYVKYDDIVADMEKRLEHRWNEKDELDFKMAISSEADKVDYFISRKQREIDSRLAYCERSLTQNRDMSQNVSRNLFDSTDDTLTEILMDLNDLSKFTRYNVLAIQNLIQKHDSTTPFNAHPLFVDIIRSKSLDRQRFDIALVKVSTLHELCKNKGQSTANPLQHSRNTNNVELTTAKYWIHADNITELKALLLFNLPVVVYNPNKPIEPSDSAVSTVYFDNPDFDLYQGTLQRDENAEIIRFRWYGTLESRQVYIERRAHRATEADGRTIRDRICMNAIKIQDFIMGKYTADQYANDLRANAAALKLTDEAIRNNHGIATRIMTSIRQKRLEPVMRIFHNRTTFQSPANQGLRITLDTELTFVREDGKMERRQGSWRRPDMNIQFPFDNINPNDIQRFPYALLETKFESRGNHPPEWLSRLLESHLVHEVPRFSKYLQGVSHFWNPRLPMLPWWLSELNVDIRNTNMASNFSGLSRSKSLKPLIDGKYRVGYLESQLQHSTTLIRSESSRKKAELTRGPSTRSMIRTRLPDMNRPSNLSAIQHHGSPNPFSSNTNSPRSLSPQTHNSQSANGHNPFDDPIWSQNDHISYDVPGWGTQDSMNGSGSTARSRTINNSTPNGDGRRLNEFHDTSSAEYLIGNKGTSPLSFNVYTEKLTHPNNLGGDDGRPNDSFATTERKGVVLTDVEKGASQTTIKKINKIDPKIYFANERTFIHWLNFSAMLLSVAMILLNFGDSLNRTVGILLFSIAFILAIYATVFYRWRGHRITHKPDQRYDDFYGPIILIVLFVGGLILNFALRFNAPYDAGSGHYLGVNTATIIPPQSTYAPNIPSFNIPVPTTAATDFTDGITYPTDSFDSAFSDIEDPATDFATDTDTGIIDDTIQTGIEGVSEPIDSTVPTGAIVP
ncbi:VTC domain-containing protein [Pilobolus umbonatus]|nr:VTC domain-containing protein [Pilobolus umbonatus]